MRSRSADKTSLKHTSRAAANADVPSPQHLEGDGRGADEIPDLMREESQAFVIASGFGINSGLVASSVLRDRTGDRVIQASVQCAEVLDVDWRIQLQREIGDGLTHIPVVVHDLRNGESLQLEIMAMTRSAPADLRIRRQVVL